MEKMKVQFTVETSVQAYTAELNVTPDEHALLVHLKYKLNQAYSDSEDFDNFNVNVKVIEK